MLTPEYFQQCKNLFVLFHYGLGGNHLSNLLSLHPNFSPRCLTISGLSYEDTLVRKYLDPDRFERFCFNVHIQDDDLVNLKVLDNPEYKQELLRANTVNILCGHWHGFDAEFRNKNLENFNDHCWVIIDIPKIKTNLLARLPTDKFKTTPGDIEKYSYPFDFSRPDITDDNCMFIDPDKFVTEHGIDYLNEKLLVHMGITLPTGANTLHEIWLKKLDEASKLVKYSL